MNRPINILIVDDDPSKSRLIRDVLAETPYNLNIDISANYENAVGKIRDYSYSIIAFDYNLGAKWTGKDLKDIHRRYNPNCKCILYSGSPDIIEDKSTYAETIDFEHLADAIINTIEVINIETDSERMADMGDQYNQKLCDERHEKLDKNIDRLNSVLGRFTFLFVGAIVSSAFAIVLSCIKLIK